MNMLGEILDTWEMPGYGTERVEEELKSLFSEARIARIDLDTTRNRLNYEKMIEKQIQMILKRYGHWVR